MIFRRCRFPPTTSGRRRRSSRAHGTWARSGSSSYLSGRSARFSITRLMRLCGSDAVGKGLAAEKVVDLAKPGPKDMNNRFNQPPGKRPSNIAFLIAIGGLLSLTLGADMIVSQKSVLGLALLCAGVGLVVLAIWWAAK